MSRKRPRRGSISGPGGPHDRDQVVIDATEAIIADRMEIALIEKGSRGQASAALLIAGRINQSSERDQVMVLLGPDGAAALYTEIEGLSDRDKTGRWRALFDREVSRRRREMP